MDREIEIDLEAIEQDDDDRGVWVQYDPANDCGYLTEAEAMDQDLAQEYEDIRESSLPWG